MIQLSDLTEKPPPSTSCPCPSSSEVSVSTILLSNTQAHLNLMFHYYLASRRPIRHLELPCQPPHESLRRRVQQCRTNQGSSLLQQRMHKAQPEDSLGIGHPIPPTIAIILSCLASNINNSNIQSKKQNRGHPP